MMNGKRKRPLKTSNESKSSQRFTSAAFMSAKILNLYDITIKNRKKMEKQPHYTANYKLDCGEERVLSDSLEELVESTKQIQSQHPKANFKIGALVCWYNIEKENG